MKLITLNPLIPNSKWISSPESFAKKARTHFHDYMENGFYKSVEEGIIIIEINNPNNTYRGIIGQLDLKDYEQGNILRHENILSAQQQTSMDLLLQRKAMIKPAMLTYRPTKIVDDSIATVIKTQKPILSLNFEERNESRKYWLVKQKSKLLKRIQKAFDKHVHKAYIADGHHRFAASNWLHNNESFPSSVLCGLFSFDQLSIYDYNRIVEKPTHLSSSNLIAQLSHYVNIESMDNPAKPTKKHEVIMMVGREWFKLRWRKKLMKANHSNKKVLFDAQLLNKYILDEIFGIENVKTDSRVTYVSGIQGLKGIEKKMNDQCVAFLLYPIKLKNLTTVVSKGGILPPKSTWFEPRLKNGMIVTTWSKE